MAPLSPTKSCGDLLSITSSKGGLKAEVATILGAQQFFHESGAPKRLVLCQSGTGFKGQMLCKVSLAVHVLTCSVCAG